MARLQCQYSVEGASHCLVTLVDAGFTRDAGNYLQYTGPAFEKYCRKYNLDYYIIVGTIGLPFQQLMYDKFVMKELFSKYSRVLYIDSDVLITDIAENIFEEVPDDSLGMYRESDVTPPKRMLPWLRRYRAILNSKGKPFNFNPKQWNNEYWNAGTMVMTRGVHDYMLEDIQSERVYNFCNEQGWINYLIAKDKVKMYNIGIKFSGWFTELMEFQENCEIWKNCHFIHFTRENNKAERIRKCIDFLKTSHTVSERTN